MNDTRTAARQRAEDRLVTARNNPRETTRLDRDTLAILEAQALDLATSIEEYVPNGRLKSLALTHLEETLTWANKAVYTQGAVEGSDPAPGDPHYEPPQPGGAPA